MSVGAPKKAIHRHALISGSEIAVLAVLKRE